MIEPTTRSTAGVGQKFEDLVGAWLLTGMLSGEAVPGLGGPGAVLHTQTRAMGWLLDDLLVTVSDDGAPRRLALSCKSSVQVTPSGLPTDFMRTIWQQWRRPGPFGPADRMALATRGRDRAFDEAWSDLKGWCSGGDAGLAVARIGASPKHKKVFDRLKVAAGDEGDPVEDATVVELIRRVEVLPFDFQLAPSHDEAHAIDRCRRLLRSEGGEEARKLWQALVARVEEARLGNGTVELAELRRNLGAQFDLTDHPRYAGAWRVLRELSEEALNVIETALPSGFNIHRAEAVELEERLRTGRFVSVVGESGSGKSALVATTLRQKFADAAVLWLKPDHLETALGAATRGQLGISHALIDVLRSSACPSNELVIDAAERLTTEGAIKVRHLIIDLLKIGDGTAPGPWRVVVISQPEAIDRWPEIADMALPSVTVGGVSASDVKAALRSSEALAWLAAHDDAVATLTNLRALSWVMQAEGAFARQSAVEGFSLTAVVDRLWDHWTGKAARFQSLLMRLAEREAQFERSFAISELDIADAEAFDQRPAPLPLRRNSRGRIEFQHDLAADWARFQRLKEIADHPAEWGPLAKNPLWHGALRLLGQLLLRQRAGDRTAWDTAFEALEKGSDGLSLAGDIVLDALCLDPRAEAFLNERADLLLADHGRLLNRLLRRFHHMATVPAVAPGTLLDPGLQFYVQSQLRMPIYGRWPPVARFLTAHRDRVAALMSPAVTRLCETWVTRTPAKLQSGAAMPYREAFAILALAGAREMQVAHTATTIFADQSERPVYAAALASAGDLPDEIGQWALEMARRRPLRADIAERIAEHRRQAAARRAERMRVDAAFREREAQRKQSMPMSLGMSRRLPPWPLGATGRIVNEFRRACLHAGGLTALMRVRPDIAAEVLLATIIEDEPREDDSRGRSPDELGLEFDGESYPTAYWKSPFFQFLHINAETALTTLIKLVNFATEQGVHDLSGRRGPGPPPGVDLTLEGGAERRYIGNRMTFEWGQANSHHCGQLHCALAALERWLCLQVEIGADVVPVIDRLLRETNSLGVLGVVVNVGKYRPELFAGALRPLLASWELYRCDDHRVRALPYHFNAYTWARAGETVFQMARDWADAPYRNVALRRLVADLVQSDSGLAQFVREASRRWPMPAKEKDAIELRILAAELDADNYRPAAGQGGDAAPAFRYPEALQSEIDAYDRKTRPTLQTLAAPDVCAKALARPQALTPEECAMLVGVLDTTPTDTASDEATRQCARVAVASTLIVKGRAWLDCNPARREDVDRVVLNAVAGIGDAAEALRMPSLSAQGNPLVFAARAVMHRWMIGDGPREVWEPVLLRLMTSRDYHAVANVMAVAHARRTELGGRWRRLMQVLAVWSALSAAAPDYDDPPFVAYLWTKWLRSLRRFRLDVPDINVEAVDLLDLAQRVERLQRRRWERANRRERGFKRLAPTRHSHGLDTEVLRGAFSWLLHGPPASASGTDVADASVERTLLKALWAFEVWLNHADVDDDEDHRPSSQLGSAVLDSLAQRIAHDPPDAAAELWRPVLSLGPKAHYAIGYFFTSWFSALKHGADVGVFVRIWRAMLSYMMDEPAWTAGRPWYHREELLRHLLGFGSHHLLAGHLDGRPLVLHLHDDYARWTEAHLSRDEDNVAGFCGFLASDAGKPLRVEGIRWLATALLGEKPCRWHRERVGNALLEFLDVFLEQEGSEAVRHPNVREALVGLAALLVARQTPHALALQERVQRLR